MKEVGRHIATNNEAVKTQSTQEIFEQSESNHEKAFYAHLQLIALCNAPISCIKNDYYRRFSKFEESFTRKFIIEALHVLVEMAKKRISSEMKKTKGAIMHDCWNCSSVHYLVLCGRYVKPTSKESNVVGPLLSVSPMAKTSDCYSTSTFTCCSEASEFNSQTLANHIQAIFKFYEVHFSE